MIATALAILKAIWNGRAAAPWVLLALAVAWGLLERTGRHGCIADRAADRAKAEAAARAALELDAINVREIVAQAEADKAELRREARQRDDAIYRAAPGACPNGGPFGALFDGVRAKQRAAGGGQAAGAGGGR